MSHKPSGFTLIEMMIALAVITILTGYAVPNYQAFKHNKIMTTEINRLISSLHFARNQSIIYGSHVILCPSVSLKECDADSFWHKGWLVFKDDNQNRQLDNNEIILTTEQAMQESLKAVASVYRQKIRYDRLGSSPGTNLSIRFCDLRGDDHAKTVIVNNVGRPRVAESGQC
ncbi:GspH/FimT family pseudopilin [Marinicella gelatinilytica]|uniref:GspH/FimT family pseudopilin n=1 Tax=Marinicella gelatinilytica TaxID=2996017 RepID=UPI002260BB05|nr:GspH/FimT family pseudopilin [Marinicella gelatinilytica]MCX7545166.1 GspH/FimT family pseudopilin [Marinicella gelatinilytica]